MKAILLPILTFLVATSFAQTPSDLKYINDTLIPSTALLYSQSEDGTMKMRCTGTMIEKTPAGYTFVTAAHCACVDNTDKETVSPEQAEFFVTNDDKDKKSFLKATITGCGYRHKGDDFAIFDIKTTEKFTTVELGKDPTILNPIVNVASPLGLGKQVFMGSVSSPILDRPVIEDDINWEGAVLIQLFGVDGGSSGSSVLCLDQHAICAFVVGSIHKTTMVAMPVSRLNKLQAGLKDGSYKKWKPEPVQAGGSGGAIVRCLSDDYGYVYCNPYVFKGGGGSQ